VIVPLFDGLHYGHLMAATRSWDCSFQSPELCSARKEREVETVMSTLALDLADITVEQIGPAPAADEMLLESLMSGHGMTELAASILPIGCCSCCIPCCCC